MARIVFAWELGGGAGHLTQDAPIAAGLVAEGHWVGMLSRDLGSAQLLLDVTGAELFQAPPPRCKPEPDIFADSYADVLLRQGYDDPAVFGAMVRDSGPWR